MLGQTFQKKSWLQTRPHHLYWTRWLGSFDNRAIWGSGRVASLFLAGRSQDTCQFWWPQQTRAHSTPTQVQDVL